MENRVICVSGIGSNKPFQSLMASMIPCLDLLEKTQCFPFYTYDEDGSNRRENITDWALAQFRSHYGDNAIGKWDIFHYVYGLLHHPQYRTRYRANLKRDLPHIPFVGQPQGVVPTAADGPVPNAGDDPVPSNAESGSAGFWAFANAGARLAEIHVGYEAQPEYCLKDIENRDAPLNWRVEKMRLSKDKTQIEYNDFLTLAGIPPKAFDYQLGNRSALEWIIDQYCVKTDNRSGIINDPNREGDPKYIYKLIGKVIAVSLETVAIVEGLPRLEIREVCHD